MKFWEIRYRWLLCAFLVLIRFLTPFSANATRTIGVYGDKEFDRLKGKIEVTDNGYYAVWISKITGQPQDIVVTNLRTGGMRVLTKTNEQWTYIHLSNDNETVAILYGLSGYRIEIYDISTGLLKQSLQYERSSIVDRFLDGSFLLVAFIPSEGINKLLRLYPDTGTLETIPTTMQPCYGCDVELSPNNRWILYDTGNSQEQAILPAIGGTATTVSPPIQNGLRIWANEPTTLYARAVNQPGELYKYNLVTGIGSLMSNGASYSDHLGISDDGRYLFFSDRLYVVRLDVTTGELERLYTIPHNHRVTRAIHVAPGWLWIAVRNLSNPPSAPALFLRVSYGPSGIVETVGNACSEGTGDFLLAPAGEFAIYPMNIDGYCYLAASQVVNGVPNVIYPSPIIGEIEWDLDYESVRLVERIRLPGNVNGTRVVRVYLDGRAPKVLFTLPMAEMRILDVALNNALVIGSSYEYYSAGKPLYVINDEVGDIEIEIRSLLVREGDWATITLRRKNTTNLQSLKFQQGDDDSYILENPNVTFLVGESEATIRVYIPAYKDIRDWRTYYLHATFLGEGSINGDPYITITVYDERYQHFIPTLYNE